MLASPAVGHRLWHKILSWVKLHLQRWADGDLGALWSEAVADGQTISRQQSSSPQQNQNIRRAKQGVQDGQYSKAIKALTSEGLAMPSPEVLQEMLVKHPQSALLCHLAPAAKLYRLVILKGVRSFPSGLAPGPSGLRPSHLREAVECPSPDCKNLMLSSLTNYINLLAAGHTPLSVLPNLFWHYSPHMPKEEWWTSPPPPIAVGEVF